jgi:hypothetical protein
MTEIRREPVLGAASFNCPHCGALAQQATGGLAMRTLSAADVEQAIRDVEEGDPQGPESMAMALQWILGGNRQLVSPQTNFDDHFITGCLACRLLAYWHGDTMVWPLIRRGRQSDDDMPADIAALYEEARDVAQRSPRAAATLLRVALERLVNLLVPGSESLNNKIGVLVGRGLSPRVQKAMDAARIFGNDSAHPGELDLSDTARTTDTLFDVINIIVRQVLTDEKVINELYERIPEPKQAAIDRRNTSARPLGPPCSS